MNRLPACVTVAVAFLLSVTTALHSQQNTNQRKAKAKQAEALVRSLYHLVVVYHPVSIPDEAEMKVFAPYLSKSLLKKIDLASSCAADWHRKNPPPPMLKPPFGWLESGLFSGGNEKASPRLYHVGRTELMKDDSSRVHVRLTWGRSEDPWVWNVAALVIKENGRFVVDDVIYLKDDRYPEDPELRLSEALQEGCDGPRWVGYSGKQ